MSNVLAVNAGSSSLKIQLLDMPESRVLASVVVERIGLSDGIFTLKHKGEKQESILDIPDHQVAAQLVLDSFIDNKVVDDLNSIVAVGHRIVHGGEYFNQSVKASPEAIAKVEELSDLAPLHNPANLTGYHSFKKALPNATHTFTFDTAFHQTMEEDVFMYAIPYEYYTDHQVRRYGAHGISHDYISKRTAELMGRDPKGLNIISLHLGNGASLTAIEDGQCVNTSMGFTPLAGLMMGTRSGDLDPAIITYLMEKLNISATEVMKILNEKSGMAGVSGLSSDARDIEQGIEDNNSRAILTRKMYAQRVLEFVGAYTMQLGHVDALVFTAGLGENDTGTREAILEALKPGLKLEYDKELNSTTRGKEMKISTDESEVEIWIVPTDEESVIAADAFRLHNE